MDIEEQTKNRIPTNLKELNELYKSDNSQKVSQTEQAQQRKVVYKRPLFVAFWLWLCVIVHVITTIIFIVKMFSSLDILMCVNFALQCVWLLGYIFLLMWNKTGFYILCGSTLIAFGYYLVMSNFVGVIMPIIFLIITYAVLQKEYKGFSYWVVMDISRKQEK